MLVCDPFGYDWNADWTTDDIDEFVKVARDNEGCLLVVDEAGEAIGNTMPFKVRHRLWLATGARHKGHASIFIAQRAPMLSPSIVRNCEIAWIFRQHRDDLKELTRTFTNDGIMEATKLDRYQCIFADNFGHWRFLDLNSDKKGVDKAG